MQFNMNDNFLDTNTAELDQVPIAVPVFSFAGEEEDDHDDLCRALAEELADEESAVINN